VRHGVGKLNGKEKLIMGKHLRKRKSVSQWLSEEFELTRGEWDIIWRTSKHKYRVHQFTWLWWVLGWMYGFVVMAMLFSSIMLLFLMGG
jgi:hypothetical protein